MKYLKSVILMFVGILLASCSFGYDIIVINDSNQPIEIYYKIAEKQSFNEPQIKSLEDWKTQKSIRRLWTETKNWQQMSVTDYETDLNKRERLIRLAPHQLVQIESGNYNPVTENYGDLTSITELKIKSANGEISYQGKILLTQFEKVDYTFIKTYKDELKNRDLK